MGETTQEQRSAYINDTGADGRPTISALLARDAKRLAEIERQVRELAKRWREDDDLDRRYAFTPSECAEQLERILDTEKEAGDG